MAKKNKSKQEQETEETQAEPGPERVRWMVLALTEKPDGTLHKSLVNAGGWSEGVMGLYEMIGVIRTEYGPDALEGMALEYIQKQAASAQQAALFQQLQGMPNPGLPAPDQEEQQDDDSDS